MSSKSSSLLLAAARLAAETDRADAAERQVADLLAQLRLFHKDRLQLRAELAKAHQELQLWKVQLDLAQKEILRAQAIVDQVDRARADAEEQARRYRRRARELLDERSIQAAVDQGRRLGFQEGLELGRRRQPVLPVSRHPSRQRPPSRSAAAPTSAPAPPPVPPAPTSPPVLDPNIAPVAPPPRPTSVVNQESTNLPKGNHSIHRPTERTNNTFEVPPDNFIPVVYEGEAGITLPPPHEWASRPRSDSQGTRPRSESRASARSVRQRSDSRTGPPKSSPPLVPVPEVSHSHRGSPPRSKTPSVASPQSSRISQFDLVGPPTHSSKKSRMTQPERIADEWRSQNPDVATPSQTGSSPPDIIPRPMSSEPIRTVRPNPPQRPTTTDPTRSRSTKSRKPREVVLPIPVPSVFYDTNNPPSGQWLQSQFQKQRSVSNATIPNIDVEPPSQSPTNTEKTVVDAILLTSDNSNHATPLPETITTGSVAPAPFTTTNVYSKPDNQTGGAFYHPPSFQTDDGMKNPDFNPGIFPITKILPPGFVPLSPIPSLGTLSAIPESSSGDDDTENGNTPRKTPPHFGGPIYSSAPMPFPGHPDTHPVTASHAPFAYQGFYPVQPMDITVMRTRAASPPNAMIPQARGHTAFHAPALSPAPLDRPLSLFSDM